MKNYIFYAAVLYYAILNYFNYLVVERFSILYFLLVLPIAIFIACFSIYLFTQYSLRTFALACFLFIVVGISLFRLDWWTIASAFLLISTMIVVINAKVSFNMRFINTLFLLCVVGSIVSYHQGINVFGYIPRIHNLTQADIEGVGLRISLFPRTPESAFFSLFIIISNYYHNPSKSRFLYYALGGYFMVFSASRTAIAVGVFFVAFELITRFISFRYRPFYLFLNVLFVLAFVVMSNLKSFHLWISRSDNEIMKSIVLRTEKNISSTSNTYDIATRLWIWEKHFEILGHSPLFGVGTYNFGDYVPNKTKVYHYSTGSESFLTSWMARIGMAIILLLVFVVLSQNISLMNMNKFGYVMSLFIFLVMISYGSFVVPYNFMFLLMVVALGNVSANGQHPSRRKIASPPVSSSN